MGNSGVSILSRDQARAITHGRTPLVPVEYEAAIKALAECVTLDETKYWSDKADALAAWAKIYHSDEAQRKARALKLHAYRRMSQIAEELRPKKNGGSAGGPNSLLHEYGFTKQESKNVRAVGRAPQPIFDTAVHARVPPSPASFRKPYTETESARRKLMTFYGFRDLCRMVDPSDIVTASASNKRQLSGAVVEINEWLDKLDQLLEADRT